MIETGIKFHRSVDAFVDAHPAQRRSIDRFAPEFRRYGGIICDVVYDHFLAEHWATFNDQEFLAFCEDAYQSILDEHLCLGAQASRTIRKMQEFRSLENYCTEQYISRSLSHIGQRLKRDNPLDRAFGEFAAHRKELEADFFDFMPATDGFAKDWLLANAAQQTS